MPRLIYCGRCGKQFSSDAAEKVKHMVVCPPCAAKLNSAAWLPPAEERASASPGMILIALVIAAIVAALAVGWWMSRRGTSGSSPASPAGPSPSDGAP